MILTDANDNKSTVLAAAVPDMIDLLRDIAQFTRVTGEWTPEQQAYFHDLAFRSKNLLTAIKMEQGEADARHQWRSEGYTTDVSFFGERFSYGSASQ